MNMAVIDHLLHVYMTGELNEYGCYRSPLHVYMTGELDEYGCYRSPPSCIHD